MDIEKSRHHLEDPLLTALTILMIVMMFVVAPLQALGIFGFQVFELLLAIMLVAGVFVISGSHAAVAAMVVALVMIIAAAVLRLRSPSILDLNLFAGAWLIVGVTLAWAVARATFAPGRVTYHRILGAVLLYLTVAIIFAALYTFIGTLQPNAFANMTVEDSPKLATQLIYFSFATMTTTGYGDISPLHPLARAMCNLEAIFGQLYPATLLARLVTLEIEHRKE
jgi:hypothetical protein